MSPVPTRHEPSEAWLTRRGVSFTGPSYVPMDKVKHDESRNNQARAEALDPGVVEEYTNAVRAGDEFPPVVLYKSGSGFVLIDGNHRDEAYLRGRRETIPAYRVADDTPSDLIELLTVEANTRHGQRTDSAWRVTQALHLLSAGHDMDTVTSATGVTQSQISAAKRVAKADDRARRVGIYGWDNLSNTNKGLLSSLTTDPVFSAAAEVVIDTAMGTDDLKGFVRQVKAANSEADALKVIGGVGEERKARQSQVKKGRRQALANPRTRVVTALGAVIALTPSELPRLFRTEAERKNVATRCADAAMVLMEMEEVLRDAAKA